MQREIEAQESAYMSKLKQPASAVVVVKVRVLRNAGELIATGCRQYPETASRRGVTLICEKEEWALTVNWLADGMLTRKKGVCRGRQQN